MKVLRSYLQSTNSEKVCNKDVKQELFLQEQHLEDLSYFNMMDIISSDGIDSAHQK